MAANKALPLIAVGAAAIILLPKKKKKATRGTGKKPEDKTPRIQFDDECGWLIPDDWWEKAGGPRFKKIVDDGLAGAADWPAKFELLKAFLLLRTDGDKAFVEKLNEVIINFPNTEESDHAEAALEKFNQMSGTKKEQN